MFERVHSVDWARLSHSHGTAEDVPARLAALAGTSDEDRKASLAYFWEFMLHQGSRYEASPHVVKFLFEALEAAECPIRRELIDLLLALAVGYGESFLPYGYDLREEEQRFQQQASNCLYAYDDARSAYFEVHERAAAFRSFLHPAHDFETRLSAGFAIAHFAQSLADAHVDVAAYMQIERDALQLQSLILCFGMLARYSDPRPEITTLTRFLDSSGSHEIRVASSIAIATICGHDTPERAVHTLLTALTESWKLRSPRDHWEWWNDGDLLGYAAVALRLLGRDRRDEIARALCKALESMEACTFAIPYTLLDLLFPEPKPTNGWSISQFDEVQQASLRVLLGTVHWRDWMISSRFLPSGLTGDSYRSALRRFVEEASGGECADFDLIRRAGNVSSWDLAKHWP